MNLLPLFKIFVLTSLIPGAALAYTSRDSGSETDSGLSTAAGISAPSVTSSLSENPAGLVNNRQSKIHLIAATSNSSLDTIGYGGGFFTGNGSAGGGIELQGFNQTDGSAGSISLLNWGLAATIESLGMAIGISGTHTFYQNGISTGTGTGNAWGLDAGILFNPHGPTRIGLTAFQILNNVDAFGAGYAMDLGSSATFAIDGTYTTGSKTTTAKPGLTLHLPSLQMTAGYGFRVSGEGWSWIRTGLSLGLGIPFGHTAFLEAYYNELAYYYLGLSIYL